MLLVSIQILILFKLRSHIRRKTELYLINLWGNWCIRFHLVSLSPNMISCQWQRLGLGYLRIWFLIIIHSLIYFYTLKNMKNIFSRNNLCGWISRFHFYSIWILHLMFFEWTTYIIMNIRDGKEFYSVIIIVVSWILFLTNYLPAIILVLLAFYETILAIILNLLKYECTYWCWYFL